MNQQLFSSKQSLPEYAFELKIYFSNICSSKHLAKSKGINVTTKPKYVFVNIETLLFKYLNANNHTKK